MDCQLLAARQLVESLPQTAQRNVEASLDALLLPFPGGTNIEDQGRLSRSELFGKCWCSDALCAPHQVGACLQNLHAAFEVTYHMIETDTTEPHCHLLLSPWFSNNHDWLFAIQDGTGPSRKFSS